MAKFLSSPEPWPRPASLEAADSTHPLSPKIDLRCACLLPSPALSLRNFFTVEGHRSVLTPEVLSTSIIDDNKFSRSTHVKTRHRPLFSDHWRNIWFPWLW